MPGTPGVVPNPGMPGNPGVPGNPGGMPLPTAMKLPHSRSHRHPASSRRHAPRSCERGIALLIVMISILVLTILAAGFAYSMKVETKLARNANSEAELEWLGRSGVEYCRWVLANSLANPMQPYDSLDQPWATGSGWLGPTNNPIAEVQNPFTLGHGTVSWKITDLESKFNINSPEPMLQQVLPQALTLMGVDPGEATPIVNSILDWIDPDDQTHVEGAETRLLPDLTAALCSQERSDRRHLRTAADQGHHPGDLLRRSPRPITSRITSAGSGLGSVRRQTPCRRSWPD